MNNRVYDAVLKRFVRVHYGRFLGSLPVVGMRQLFIGHSSRLAAGSQPSQLLLQRIESLAIILLNDLLVDTKNRWIQLSGRKNPMTRHKVTLHDNKLLAVLASFVSIYTNHVISKSSPTPGASESTPC